MSVDLNDFLLFTRDYRVADKKVLTNEATLPRYFVMSRLMKSATKKFKGGEKLVDHIQGETLGNAGYYNPLNAFNVSTRDTSVEIRVFWAYLQAHYPLVDEAVELNQGDPDAFVDFLMSQEQGCVVDKVNTMERACWALPNFDTMEAENIQEEARRPYSFLCMVTRDGLAPSASNGGIESGSSAWTTLQGQNPANLTWYRNQFNDYNFNNPNSIENGIIPAFDEMVELVEFEMPGELATYAETMSLQLQVIATNLDGQVKYKSALRAVNDRMERLNDPTIRGPQYDGIPVKYISQLDQAGWTVDQPDYLWLNLAWMYPFFHTTNYMKEKITPGGTDHPNKVVVWKFTWHNIICRSRRRQGRTFGAAL